jgi:hypothetical protein
MYGVKLTFVNFVILKYKVNQSLRLLLLSELICENCCFCLLYGFQEYVFIF